MQLNSCANELFFLEKGTIKEEGAASFIVNKYISEGRKIQNELNRNLSNGTYLVEFKITPPIAMVREDLEFTIKIKYEYEKPIINDLCILLYNYRNVRVAIVDLRSYLNQIRYQENFLTYKGRIVSISVVEGDYYFGLYYNINNTAKDIYDINVLTIKPNLSSNSSTKCELQYRGFIELNHQCIS